MSKLILIDDDVIFNKMAQLVLKIHNPVTEVISYTDGEATLKYLIENCLNDKDLPDYIFVDIYMPGYSGWDFLNDYKKIHYLIKKPIQIHLISNSFKHKDFRKSKKYPFVNSFIIKPLNHEHIKTLFG